MQPTPPYLKEQSRAVADDLQTLISSLQSRATTIYRTIVTTLIVGVFLIIFAGFFSSFDAQLLWWRLDDERKTVYSEYYSALALPSSNITSAERARSDHDMDKYWTNYNHLLGSAIDDEYGQKSLFNWIPVVLKVSIAGLLIFLVQILILMYRHNSSLIVFYSSRRYAIIMSDRDLNDIEKWAVVFAPVNLDFGRDPRNPLNYIVSLLRRERTSDEEFWRRRETGGAGRRGQGA